MQNERTKDFFISYTRADFSWAEWIAWVLEESGYKITLAAWHFRPGDNFIEEMHRSLQKAQQILAVLTLDYLNASYTQDEWSAAFVKNTKGTKKSKKNRIVPVRVKKCEPVGLFSNIIPIDLVGLAEDKARDTLLAGLRPTGKPPVKPTFPGLTFPGTLPLVWNIPHNRNLKFTGRENFLADLHKTLTSGKPPALAQAIVGQAGVGKTQIALEYAYRHAVDKKDYEFVWWLRAEALATDYTNLARMLKLSEKEVSDQNAIIKSVQQWLRKKKKWLLIFDNVRNQAEVRNYLPRAGTGHVLITSQNSNWRGLANTLPVKVMQKGDAANLIQKGDEER
jgi:hypothetical protein